MSARSLGRGKCPKCGREGSVVIKTLGGREYVYIKHGREWHYIGPLNNVDLASLFSAHTTTLPLKGGGPSLDVQRPNSVVALIAGIILIVIGALIVFFSGSLFLALGFYIGTSVKASQPGGFGNFVVDNTSIAYIVNYLNDTMNVSVTGSAPFQVLVVPISVLEELSPSVSPAPGAALGMNVIHNVTKHLSMAGNYTSFSTSLAPLQGLLVRPLSKAIITISFRYSATLAQQTTESTSPGLFMALLAAPLVLGIGLIAGGAYLLYKSGRGGSPT